LIFELNQLVLELFPSRGEINFVSIESDGKDPGHVEHECRGKGQGREGKLVQGALTVTSTGQGVRDEVTHLVREHTGPACSDRQKKKKQKKKKQKKKNTTLVKLWPENILYLLKFTTDQSPLDV
jgi:hypothetical protein